MGREGHTFNLAGGNELTTLGAAWFVSYCYYIHIDKNHLNWNSVSTYKNRISVFNSSTSYHKYWLQEVLNMNPIRLNKNSLGLNGNDIKKMATELLKII